MKSHSGANDGIETQVSYLIQGISKIGQRAYEFNPGQDFRSQVLNVGCQGSASNLDNILLKEHPPHALSVVSDPHAAKGVILCGQVGTKRGHQLILGP